MATICYSELEQQQPPIDAAVVNYSALFIFNDNDATDDDDDQ